MKNSEFYRADTTGNPTHTANGKTVHNRELYICKKEKNKPNGDFMGTCLSSMAFGVCMLRAKKRSGNRNL